MTKEDVYSHYAFENDLKERFLVLIKRRVGELSYDENVTIRDFGYIRNQDAFRVDYTLSGGHYNRVYSFGSIVIPLSEVCEL